jgi:exosortase
MERTQTELRAVSGSFRGNRFLMDWRFGACTLVCLLPILLAWGLTQRVVQLAFTNDTFTHIPLIPLISGFLIYSERRSIFSRLEPSWMTGLSFLAPGLAVVLAADFKVGGLSPTNQISVFVFGVILIWIGAFGMFFGSDAFRAARFSLLFLFFMVPIPEPLLSKVIFFLQEQSASATEALFSLFGVPFLRQDLVFSLPGMAIRIAEECSGIRSTLALLIMTVLASHMFLKTTWKQVLVCLLVIPLSIAKNGLRISVLSALAVYVDQRFLTGPIHHQFGGMLFFAAAFVPLALTFVLLQKSEQRKVKV